MADRTGIEWTDATLTPIRARNRATGKLGWHCVHVSPGCKHCYAERWNKPRGAGLPFKPGHLADVEIILDERMLLQPLRWRAPRKIFVCSTTDLFADFVPTEMIDRVFAVMALTPHHTYQVLTKRSARMRAYLTDPDLNDRISAALGCMLDGEWIWNEGKRFRPAIEKMISVFLGMESDDESDVHYHDDPMPLPNVWLGVSAEDQARADERVPDLLATPAAVRFVSAEPLLGAIDLQRWIERCHANRDGDCAAKSCPQLRDAEPGRSGRHCPIDVWTELGDGEPPPPHLDWIIVGGESGPGARPMHPAWVRSIRDQCAAAGVAFHFKQWGEWAHPDASADGLTDGPAWRSPSTPIHVFDDNVCLARVGKKAAGRLLDGVEHSAMPQAAP